MVFVTYSDMDFEMAFQGTFSIRITESTDWIYKTFISIVEEDQFQINCIMPHTCIIAAVMEEYEILHDFN